MLEQRYPSKGVLAVTPEEERRNARVIGAAVAVHRQLGPGFLESVYHESMKVRLSLDGVDFRTQWEVHITYEERPVGKHRLDLLVEDRLIVELKAVANEMSAAVPLMTEPPASGVTVQ